LTCGSVGEPLACRKEVAPSDAANLESWRHFASRGLAPPLVADAL